MTVKIIKISMGERKILARRKTRIRRIRKRLKIPRKKNPENRREKVIRVRKNLRSLLLRATIMSRIPQNALSVSSQDTFSRIARVRVLTSSAFPAVAQMLRQLNAQTARTSLDLRIRKTKKGASRIRTTAGPRYIKFGQLRGKFHPSGK